MRTYGLAVVIVIAVPGLASAQEPPRPMPKEIIDAWWAAGFRYYAPSDTKPGDLPRFELGLWLGEEAFAKVPLSEQPFGLSIGFRFTKDSALQGLARLKSLQALHLRDARLRDADMKHLAGLTNLQSLNVSFSEVTDAGLAHAAGLTELAAKMRKKIEDNNSPEAKACRDQGRDDDENTIEWGGPVSFCEDGKA